MMLLEFKPPNFMTNRLYIEFLTAVNIAEHRYLLLFHMEHYVFSPVLCTIKEYVFFHMIYFFLTEFNLLMIERLFITGNCFLCKLTNYGKKC